jgi:hypothetical protein
MNEVDMILKPLFQDISMDVTVVHKQVQIVVTNSPLPARDFDTNIAVLDLVNEWNMHDRLRRFMIKGISNANRNQIHRYQPGIAWRCPMDVYYVFEDELMI